MQGVDKEKNFHDDTFMTNIDAYEKERILRAAKDTGFDIFVCDNAFYGEYILLKGYVAVHTNEKGKDHSKFWDRFHELQRRGDDGSKFKKLLSSLKRNIN